MKNSADTFATFEFFDPFNFFEHTAPLPVANAASVRNPQHPGTNRQQTHRAYCPESSPIALITLPPLPTKCGQSLKHHAFRTSIAPCPVAKSQPPRPYEERTIHVRPRTESPQERRQNKHSRHKPQRGTSEGEAPWNPKASFTSPTAEGTKPDPPESGAGTPASFPPLYYITLYLNLSSTGT